MIKVLKSLYFHQRVFTAVFSIAGIFLFSYWIPALYAPAWIAVVLLALFILLDMVILYRQPGITAKRIVADKLSNSDDNPVEIQLYNSYNFKVGVEVIDELPVQFQKRDFRKLLSVNPGQKAVYTYYIRPVERGVYEFGRLNIYVSTSLHLVKKRLIYEEFQRIRVYPSFIQMRSYDFLALDNRIRLQGLKKIRRIGHTQEFEQIKEYVAGDDVRSINWKATAKQASLMVNQFQDEKSQPVYSLIDTGRVMKMPFNGLSLLDYAINSTLAFSNIALQKKDRVGMLSFSDETGNLLTASSKKSHLNLILEKLYNITTAFLDSDFGLLYASVKRKINQRSLLMIYTNFEHMNGLNRNLPYLKALAKKHIVVVIFFENVELEKVIHLSVQTIPDIAHQTIAEDFSYQKKLMAKKLQQQGIHTVLTRPEELTVNTINKYLEIKARGIL